jgi:hypothetical protein
MFTSVEILPSLPVIPAAHAAGGSAALLSLFNEQRKNNVVFDTGQGIGTTFVMDVNVTSTGSLKAVRIGINFTSGVLTVSSVVYSNTVALDTHIKYVNTTTAQTHWNPGNAVVYDANNNFIFDAGDTVISGTPAANAKLKNDLRLKYVDANNNGVWNAGESVFYDVLNIGVFAPGDTLLAGPVPGLFDGVSTSHSITTINNGAGFIDYSITDIDAANPTVSGTGVIMRITFTVGSVSSSKIHLSQTSGLSNPAPLVYQAIDGYFSNSGTDYSYSVGNNQPLVTVVRLVSGTNDTLPIATVNVIWAVGTAHTVITTILGLPSNTVAVLNSTVQNSISCSLDSTHPCHFTLQLRVNGGSASAPSTSPSGTYPLAIIGNTSATAGPLIRQAWATLIIQPPHPPTFTVSAPSISFTQQAGNYTLIPVTVALTCSAPTQCANDSVSLSSNVVAKAGGSAFSFTPSTGKFTLTSSMNVSTPAILGVGAYRFNITATTLGTYSEVSLAKNLTMTMNVLRTHDLAVTAEAVGRLFSYAGVSLAANPIKVNGTIVNQGTVSETFSANVTAKVALSVDFLISGVSYHQNFFTLGDPVVYDSNGDGIADAGDILISAGSTFTSDIHIKFVNATTSPTETWAAGKTVVYDPDNDGIFTIGSGDLAISGVPANGAKLKNDPLLKFVDFNANGHWDSGEAVVYDANNSNQYVIGDYLVAPSLGTFLTTDLNNLLKFVDSNYNAKWVPGDAVAFDSNGNGVYDAGEPVITGSAISTGYLVATQTGIVLAPSASQIVMFNVDPGAVPHGTYVLYVEVQRVTGEFRVDNNLIGLVPFTQKLKGDVSGDCKVDIVDLSTVGAQFLRTTTSPGFNAAADLNNDGVINIVDLVLISGNFLQHC